MTLIELFIRSVSLLCIAAILQSCVSYKALPQNDTTHSLSSSVKTGDMVKVVLKNGDKINYVKVISADEEYIVGTHMLLKHNQWHQESAMIKISDIQIIKKRKFSTGKTVALGIGLIPVGLLIYFLFNPPVFRLTL